MSEFEKEDEFSELEDPMAFIADRINYLSEMIRGEQQRLLSLSSAA